MQLFQKNVKFFSFVLMFFSFVNAQSSISGNVSDSETGELLVGANITIEETSTGTSTNSSGFYSIDIENGDYNVSVSYIGYEDFSTNVTVDGETNLNIFLLSDPIQLSELEVLADRANELTPVRAENINSADMSLRLGSQDIPLVLNTIPGVYASDAGAGAGDATIYVRGFNQRNVAIMINGVPVNDMENGWVYWSNWDGVGDATRSIQLQKGMGNVNLATPAIGGTMNIVTDPASRVAGGTFKQEVGEWGFLKSTLGYNTGLVNDTWALSGLIVRKTGDGYRGGTWTDAWAYSFGATYRLSNNDQFQFYAIGAPQRHGQALYRQNMGAIDKDFALSQSDYDPAALYENDGEYIPSGHDFNQNWNNVNESYSGQQYFRQFGHNTQSRIKSGILNERENFFHKPIIGFNYFKELNDDTRLSAVLYHSPGEGGGTGTYGDVARIDAAGKSDLDSDGHKFYYGPSPWVWDWNGTIDANSGSASDVVVFQRDTVSRGNKESIGILRNSQNIQKVTGAVLKMDYDFSSSLKLGLGLDIRGADIYHIKTIRDLLGGDYFVNTDSEFDAPGTRKVLGDPIDYDFLNIINWTGFYGQIQYNSGPINAFAMYGISSTNFEHRNNFKADSNGNKLILKENGLSGSQLKLGARYSLTSQLSFFGNYGMVSKLPNFDQVIDDYTAIINPDYRNEEFNSVELGADFRTNNLTLTGTYYNTAWTERVYKYEEYELESGNEITAWLHGVDAVHSGIEFTAAYQPSTLFRLEVAGSLGDWKHTDDASGEIRFKSVDPLYGDAADTSYTVNYYINDLPTGGAPQTQFVLAASFFPIEGLKAQLLARANSDFYSYFNPFNRTDAAESGITSWKIPDYSVLDFHASYSLPINIGSVKPRLFVNVFNLTDEKYILEAVDNSKYNAHDKDHDADDAEVFFGLPFRWNTGISINF